MKLVDYLRSLFKATSARPSVTPQVIEANNTDGNFVASSDCWVSVQADTPTTEAYYCYCWSEQGKHNPTAGASSSQPAGWSVNALGFFRKGETVYYTASGFQKGSVKIFPTVSGGGLIQSLTRFFGFKEVAYVLS